MEISDEMRLFLIDISEQIRMDGIALRLAYKVVQKHDRDLADMLELVQFKGEEKWNDILKLIE